MFRRAVSNIRHARHTPHGLESMSSMSSMSRMASWRSCAGCASSQPKKAVLRLPGPCSRAASMLAMRAGAGKHVTHGEHVTHGRQARAATGHPAEAQLWSAKVARPYATCSPWAGKYVAYGTYGRHGRKVSTDVLADLSRSVPRALLPRSGRLPGQPWPIDPAHAIPLAGRQPRNAVAPTYWQWTARPAAGTRAGGRTP